MEYIALVEQKELLLHSEKPTIGTYPAPIEF
jgi:hypothetical protein